ncbi:macrophage migration inhibitory factor [Hydra vulgaris]|uniref:L-dopachrome isomerase n=1 Tax=Hydra vulgaris TaxID=6087 RepID=A0ABM4CYG9_HYDVU
MPCLRIETNVSKESFNQEKMANELLEALAKSMGKPIEYCMVVIVPDTLIFTGVDKTGKLPSVNASLMSIGCLGLKENKKLVAVLYPIIQKYLGVNEGLCYIQFKDVPSKDLSYKNMTFHDILG